ncbi:hypothetical protein LJR175_008399 [Variovorax sp. LjRoot175]|uniref:hypothetical protein n=1 Tax=Variovorax sp. LjRoot175 TaxID=3342276 RepID=UPI003ED01349
MLKKTIAMLGLALLAGVHGAAANTFEWYKAHPEQAKAMFDACKERLKSNEKLSQAEREECRRAGDAVMTGGKYERRTPAKTW